jgi:hypothetical protein
MISGDGSAPTHPSIRVWARACSSFMAVSIAAASSSTGPGSEKLKEKRGYAMQITIANKTRLLNILN